MDEDTKQRNEEKAKMRCDDKLSNRMISASKQETLVSKANAQSMKPSPINMEGTTLVMM